ncbi:hypothetical protein L1987_10927 [Smallanthus sonchifolius]|uniref:Uncharacterized protein n=1 Tax=Smallanthus sonchifolius TaxID=185202 RepID=A0ACB9JB19_9ASTR|nr:hypothetical protein L1987_10927 [Smallanthus sonchifolius]
MNRLTPHYKFCYLHCYSITVFRNTKIKEGIQVSVGISDLRRTQVAVFSNNTRRQDYNLLSILRDRGKVRPHLILPRPYYWSGILLGNSVSPSLKDKSCNLYAISHASESIVLASFQYSASAERTHSVAKMLIGQQIVPERVLIFDSVQSRNFRGRISTDDTFAMKLETSREKKGSRF